MKKCSLCNEIKILEEFPKSIAKNNGKEGQCKVCVAKYKSELYFSKVEVERQKRRDYYHKNREIIKEKNRNYYRQTAKHSNIKRRCKKRGITIEQYEQMLRDQNNCCKICSNWLPESERSIDHCHKTNLVRGILCDNCNTGLGLFKDSEKLLLEAVKYLRNTRSEG